MIYIAHPWKETHICCSKNQGLGTSRARNRDCPGLYYWLILVNCRKFCISIAGSSNKKLHYGKAQNVKDGSETVFPLQFLHQRTLTVF